MSGLQFPTEILGSLSWNRLIRESYTAQPVSNPLAAKREVQIPPVALTGNGFIYLVGCDSQSALPTWRLGCSVRLSSNGNPDSGGLFTNPNGFPIRIDDRRPCTLGSYTLLTWPNMEIEQPWLILEFPFWLDDIEIEIFWYDGGVSGDFFRAVKEAVVELYEDVNFASEIHKSIESRLMQRIANHEHQGNPHQQYLSKFEAQSTYATKDDVTIAIASHFHPNNS